MTTLTYTPSYGAKVDIKPRVRKAQFGDGYAQRSAEGINNRPEIWNVTFKVPPADAVILMAFFDAAGGTTAFEWTSPSGLTANFICETWSRGFDTYGQHQVTATLEQDFAP